MNGFLEKLAKYFSVNIFIKNMNIFAGNSRPKPTRQAPIPAITGHIQHQPREPFRVVLVDGPRRPQRLAELSGGGTGRPTLSEIIQKNRRKHSDL
jgi:hypothetical protein